MDETIEESGSIKTIHKKWKNCTLPKSNWPQVYLGNSKRTQRLHRQLNHKAATGSAKITGYFKSISSHDDDKNKDDDENENDEYIIVITPGMVWSRQFQCYIGRN